MVDNLGLLVLSEEIELKMKAICLNNHCPFILEPNSSFQSFYNHLLLVIIFLQCMYIPYAFSFERSVDPTTFSVLFVFDCFYLLDIYIQLSTAIKHRNHTSATMFKIAAEKVKKRWFLMDLLAIMPLDYIAYIVDPKKRLVTLFKLNRLLKGYRLIMYMSKREYETTTHIIMTKFFKYILIYTIMCELNLAL